MNNGTQAHGDDDGSPWTQPRFLAAAMLVGLIVILGLILTVTGGSNGDANSRPQETPARPPAATPVAEDPDESVCGLAPGEQSLPTKAPDAKWGLQGTFAVPRQPEVHGPGTVRSGVPACFAHSPTGALFATVNIYAALSDFSRKRPSDPRSVIRQIIATGPGRDAILANLPSNSDSADTASASGVQIAGFSIVRYENRSAVVDVAFRVDRPGATGYVHGASTMRWERRDWKLVLAQDGRPFDSMEQIATLDGYVPWSGV